MIYFIDSSKIKVPPGEYMSWELYLFLIVLIIFLTIKEKTTPKSGKNCYEKEKLLPQ
mgnify:CR=1 FL=1